MTKLKRLLEQASLPTVALAPYTGQQSTPLGRLRPDGAHDICAQTHGHNHELNAALIIHLLAAAPKLLEALEEIHDHVPGYFNGVEYDAQWASDRALRALQEVNNPEIEQ